MTKPSEINKRLSALYNENTKDFLNVYKSIYRSSDTSNLNRLNEFGIIDEEKYNQELGLLVVLKETNGWDENAPCFRERFKIISNKGLANEPYISQRPTVWYNTGRWAMLAQNPNADIEKLACEKENAIKALGAIAITNINKLHGYATSGKEYNCLAKTEIARSLIRKEISIINPKLIICAGTFDYISEYLPEYSEMLVEMPHPGARKSTIEMLKHLSQCLQEHKK